jgi:N6-adenosine-specific RNA methylase IME4
LGFEASEACNFIFEVSLEVGPEIKLGSSPEFPSDEQAHLYLWSTNADLHDAFELMEGWASYPPYLDVFARKRRSGWTVWGNGIAAAA